MMRDSWKIEPGEIEYRSSPGFTANWSSGIEDLESLDGLCWSSKGAGEADSIHLSAITWIKGPPSQEDFERLMNEAVSSIDEWINRQM